MRQFGLERRSVLAAVGRFRVGCVYLLALAVMNIFVVNGVNREAVRIDGPGGKPCLGTVWTVGRSRMPWDGPVSRAPKAVIVLGHGVTANQGVMATAANAFARNGYVAVTIDFWGHGRSRERFDWPSNAAHVKGRSDWYDFDDGAMRQAVFASNAAQVKAWCDWARIRFKGLPLAYLGHSMGGEAGDGAFREGRDVAAFVSMGMLPRHIPACKTLIAMGRFEELFTGEQARHLSHGQADVLVSPYSDHTFEAGDPVLLYGIIAWVNAALGLGSQVTFPWVRWALMILATVIGWAAALLLAEQATALLRRHVRPRDIPVAVGRSRAVRPGRLNLFRIAGRALGCTGHGTPPRSGGLVSAAIRGIVFGVVLVVLLSCLLTTNIYTCSLNHPERCLMWLVLIPVMTLLFSLTARALERISLRTTFQRFAVGALTRAVPLLAACLVLELRGPGIAFAGMMLGILALVCILGAAIHALATRGAGDYRSGAVACGIVIAWITAFWFPLAWV